MVKGCVHVCVFSQEGMFVCVCVCVSECVGCVCLAMCMFVPVHVCACMSGMTFVCVAHM